MTELKQIQDIEMRILKIFIDICETLQLDYFALGGTLLGAVRHGGFIPWDDDIDLGMPRKDYEVFVERANEFLPATIRLIPNPANLNILQLVDMEAVIKIDNRRSHVFVDIFPLDGYPNGGVAAVVHDKKILFYRMLCKLSVVDILGEHDRGTIENIIFLFAKYTKLNRVLNTEKLVANLHKLIKMYDFDTCARAGNVLGRYRKREIVSREVFGKPGTIDFEDITISCPEKADAYLTHIYGNYLELPPEQERVSHNIELIHFQ